MNKLALVGGAKAVTLPYRTAWPIIDEATIDDVTALMRQGKLSIGDGSGPIGMFEQAFKTYTGARYALMVNSGTAALQAGLYGIGVQPVDEVIVPSYTWHAAAGAIVTANAIPVFCESDPATLNLDPDDVARRITKRTKAIAVVHMWGNVSDMDRLVNLAKQHDIRILEDCSHAHGALWHGTHVGRIGDVGCFSLQGSKVTAAGEGGILITDDPEVYDRALVLGSHGRIHTHAVNENIKRYTTGFGYKHRPHPLGAAIAFRQLQQLDTWNRQRRKNYEYLMAGLADIGCLQIVASHPGGTRGGFYGTRLLYKNKRLLGISRTSLLKALQAEGVQCDIERYDLIHLSPFYRERQRAYDAFTPKAERDDYQSGDLPVTERMHSELIALPVFTEMQFDLLDQIIEAFHKVVSSANIEELKEYDLAN